MKNQSVTKALAKLYGIMQLCIFLSFPFQQHATNSTDNNFMDCNTSPVITCPQNYFGCPGDDIHPDNTGYATAVPGEVDCDDPVVSYTDLVISEGPCTGQTLVKRIWLAEYPNNSNPWLIAECTQIILLEDVTAPEIMNCPTDITVDLNVSCDNPTWTAPTATDNCAFQEITSNYNPGDEFPEGTTTVTYTATDLCGNDSECSFDVTVIGQCCATAPIIACPSNSILCPGDDISPALNGYPTVVADPSCGPYTLSHSDHETNNDSNCSGYPLIRRTWTVSYDSHPDLTASCVQKLIFRDNEAPVFTSCPEDITVDIPGDCEGEATWDLPSAMDNCGLQFISGNYQPGDLFPEGETEVIYSAVDNCGNVTLCSFTVTVVFNCCTEPAEIACPPDYYACPGENIQPDVAGYPVVIPDPSCGPVWVFYEDIQGSNDDYCTGHPSITRIWTVKYEDYDDLMSTCTQEIIFSDQQVPVFHNCPNDLVFDHPIDVYWTAPSAYDNCSVTSLISNHTPNSDFPIGVTEVIYTASDACGNVSQCSFTITVEGSSLVLDCPDDITLDCGETLGDWQLIPSYTSSCNACDNNNDLDGFIYMGSLNGHKYYCSLFPSTWEFAEEYCQQYGGHLAAINSAEENFMLSNFLTTQSAYIGLNDVDQEGNFKWSNGDPVTYTNWYPGQPNDYLDGQDHVEMLNNGQWNDQYPHKKLEFIMEIPCVSIIQTSGPILTEPLPPGTHEITYTASDACGNYATCSFYITVESSLEIECPDDVILTCPYGSNGIVVNWNVPNVNTCCSSTTGAELDGWIWMGNYNGSNYYCTLEPYTWDEGNALCHAYGGHLATINDAGENAFLADILTIQSAYIGLYDANQEGNFVWETGEPVTYTNWYPGQPNNFNGIQDHVEMLSNGQWNDQYYYKKLECIMEIPGSVNITQIAGPPSGSIFPKGSTTTITYLVTDACGNSETCSFDITIEGEECLPTGLNSESCWIETVWVDTYKNTSGNNWGYGDFTDNCVEMLAGGSYNLRLRPACGNTAGKVYWSVYIDFNMDGDFFDGGEFVAYGSSNAEISGVLSLPTNIWNGDVTMRILMHQGSYATGPCDSYGFGEIEDYCIQVIGANAQDNDAELLQNRSIDHEAIELVDSVYPEPSVYPNPATDKLYIENIDLERIDFVELYNWQGQLVRTIKFNELETAYINVSEETPGAYLVKIYPLDQQTPYTKRVILNKL